MPKIVKTPKPFQAEQFVATDFHTAEEKAKIGNTLVAFIETGFLENKFTHFLYRNLHNMFGHIAHYNKTGFYDAQFSDKESREMFLENLLDNPCYGHAEHSVSDVEKAIIKHFQEKIKEQQLTRFQFIHQQSA
jgi:hypothetical protein